MIDFVINDTHVVVSFSTNQIYVEDEVTIKFEYLLYNVEFRKGKYNYYL